VPTKYNPQIEYLQHFFTKNGK